MKFSEWEPLYLRILADFGFDRSEDVASARILADLLHGRAGALPDLRGIIAGRDVAVCGNAPSLASEIDSILPDQIVIAADGATTVLLANLTIPDVIVTDLDGTIEDIIAASEKGSFVVVHAHGDNIPAVRAVVPLLSGKVLGTTQSEPFGDIHNFGGFSDGDRCVFLAKELGAASVTLFGFDYNDPDVTDVKKKKLDWAKRLIEEYL